MNAIEIKNLVKKFKDKKTKEVVHAVDNISFTIKKGEAVAFIGPNGAGKSTTIKMLTSILYPTSGKIKILGKRNWDNRKKLAYKIGAVFGQRSQLWMHLPAIKTFELLGTMYDLSKEQTKNRIDELVETFDIEKLIYKPVRSLSLGERMKCEIVASLIHKPEILFLDEPTIGLDVNAKATIRDLLKKQNKQEGTTILLTSHDVGDVENVCNRVLIINHGKIILDDSLSYLKNDVIKTKNITITTPRGKIINKKVDANSKALEKEIKNIIENKRFSDITIHSEPLEEIIKELYKR